MTHAVEQALIASLKSMPGAIRPRIGGRVTRYDGLLVECAGFPASPGMMCQIEASVGESARAEIIGFDRGRNLLFLDDPGAGVTVGDRVRLVTSDPDIAVGPGLLGRVVDADGEPLDGLPPPDLPHRWPLRGKPLNPLARAPVDKPLDTGVRLINAALTVGRGQRVGIFAGSGVGKSVLTGMMARFTEADVVIVGLIGERAREVGEFVDRVMSHGMAQRVSVVAVPADRSPLQRIRAAHRATAMAEYFRDRGQNVLLIMDSLTRVAHARREIGLALGEQPTSRGYPPSVVSLIPSLVERSGPGLKGTGSITAFYTVLADGDDMNDPVVDSARAILDGHLVLSRRQAQQGLFPAIDLTQSVSRVMNGITDGAHRDAAQRLRALIAAHTENRDLILMGGYVEGHDPVLDRAVKLWPRIKDFIRQPEETPASLEEARSALVALAGEGAE